MFADRSAFNSSNSSRLPDRSFGFLVLLLLTVTGFTAAAQETKTNPQGDPMQRELESRRFVGFLQALGDADPEKDAYTFKDGEFVSEGCLKWGFSPAPYWVRRDKDGLHFLAELSSPEHGTMRYEGVFDGKEVKGSVKWKKERWYWTMERDYRFTGKPSTDAQ